LLELGRITRERAGSEDRAERRNELVFKDGLLGVGQSDEHVQKRYAVRRRNQLEPRSARDLRAGSLSWLQRQIGEAMAETTRTVVIARQEFVLRPSQVERRLRGVLPEPVKEHFVVINRRRYPPKQVLGLVTGLDRAAFTTHHARRILTGLGFPADRRTRLHEAGRSSRRSAGSSGSGGAARTRARGAVIAARPSGETLEPYVGQWVATKGPEVLVGAADPRAVVGWLAEHGQQADSMFRVPQNEFEATGVAPS
jgi:hypothetical protein